MTQPATIESLSQLVDGAVASGIPAAQACVIQNGAILHHSAHGADHHGQEATLDSVFDVASVTKIAATTIAVALLTGRGELDFDDRISRFIPEFRGPTKEILTIRELLEHRAGLPAWEPFFTAALDDPVARTCFLNRSDASRRESFERSRELILNAALRTKASGKRGDRVYSDLGFMTLGHLLETVSAQSLDRLCHAEIYDVLGLTNIGFADLRDESPVRLREKQVIPTGRTRPREPAPGQESLYSVPDGEQPVVVGEVDDDNAFGMFGVAGHAGLFATSLDLARLGALLIEEIDGANRLGAGESLREMCRPVSMPPTGDPHGLGFDMPASTSSAVGSVFGRAGASGAVGHLGFTGCSLWLDLDRRLSVALLTNRTFPGRTQVAEIRALRPAFHDTIINELG